MFEGEGDVPPTQPTPIEEQPAEVERTVEEIGDELLDRLDAVDNRLAQIEQQYSDYQQALDARYNQLAQRVEEIGGHTHDGYAASEHNHDEKPIEEETGETPPAPVHRWFRKVGQ